MDNFFEKILAFVNVIAEFFKRLFTWKEKDFDAAMSTIEQYSKQGNPDPDAKEA